MNVVLAAHNIGVDRGGPSVTVNAIFRHLALAQAEPRLVTAEPGWPLRPRFHRSLRQTDIVHTFGIWLPFNHWVARCSELYARPVVLSPLGMLEPWAMEHKGFKKKLAWHLYQRRDLARVTVLHTTSESEATYVRGLDLGVPVAVIPHGVDVPDAVPARSLPHERVRTALFLSRINPKKGLLELVDAWARVRPQGWRMVITGPDEGGHRAEVARAIAQAGLGGEFEFTGPVYGEQKRRLLLAADLFVLPTHSENFGHVIAEALAHGVPVLTTTGAPWSQLVGTRSGWWVEPTPRALAQALSEATALDDGVRLQMGQRGRQLVRDGYSWTAAAEKYTALYRWALGGAPRPTFVD